MMCGPTPRLSRAAERAMIKRHGHVKEKMFQNRRWRRRLQALLGRGMADDETSGCQTGGTAGIPRSPTRAGIRRDAIRRRAIRHAIRRRTIRHATSHPGRDPATDDTARDEPSGTRSGTGSFRMRPTIGYAIRYRLFSHATDHRAHDPAPAPFARDDHDMSGYVRICPDMSGYVRICSVIPNDT